MSTPEEKLNSPTHSGPARCTLEQLRARWGFVTAGPEKLGVGDLVTFAGMGERERWRVEKIDGKRVDLVQEVERR